MVAPPLVAPARTDTGGVFFSAAGPHGTDKISPMLTATIAVIASLATQSAPQTYTGRATSITVENGTNRIVGIFVSDNPACATEYHYRTNWFGDQVLVWITCAGESPCPSYTCAVEEEAVPGQGVTIIWCECVQ